MRRRLVMWLWRALRRYVVARGWEEQVLCLTPGVWLAADAMGEHVVFRVHAITRRQNLIGDWDEIEIRAAVEQRL